ncbi:MAG: hypothetical protein ACREA9_21050 [Pyrinomonadaceae bacterium]
MKTTGLQNPEFDRVIATSDAFALDLESMGADFKQWAIAHALKGEFRQALACWTSYRQFRKDARFFRQIAREL